MSKQQNKLEHLPQAIGKYVAGLVKKIRYRRKIRKEVMQELAGHFEDALRDCQNEDQKKKLAEELIEQFGDAKLLAALIRRGKKRCRPLWRTAVARTFQAVGILFLLLVIHCVYLVFAKPSLRIDYVQEMNRLARTAMDESLNAAPLYDRAIELCKKEPEIEPGEWLLEAIGDKEWVGELTEEELAALKGWVADNKEAIELAGQGSTRAGCWWEHKSETGMLLEVLMPNLAQMRNLARVICWDAKLKASEGKLEEAFEEIYTCYRMGRHLKGPRTLIEQLVGIATEALAAGTARVIIANTDVNNDTLKNFQEQLEKLKAKDTFTADFQVERFWGLDFIQHCYTDNGRGGGRLIPREVMNYGLNETTPEPDVWNEMAGVGMGLGASVVGAGRAEIRQLFDKCYDEAERISTMTPWEVENSRTNPDPDMWIEQWSWIKRMRYWPATMLLPALGRVSAVSQRNKTEVDALITIVAVTRFKADKGQEPESLIELVESGYITSVPMDLYSDGPVVYKKTEVGFTLYSVGEDFIDDGGKIGGSAWGGGEEGGDRVFWPLETYEEKQQRLNDLK